MCDIGNFKNGGAVSFYIQETYTKSFLYKRKFYMYMRRWFNEEEKQEYNARKLAEAGHREGKGKWEKK